MNQKPNNLDIFVLCCFVVLITLQPYYLYGKINLYEIGLYLPGINAILHGGVPYRDFFHLRGPFELYMPAFLMMISEKNISVLSFYFYFGTVLTLIFLVFLGKELYQTRLIFCLMVPVLVARTFPRVVFTYWGGMRYALGILALYCAIKFFKRDKVLWIFFAGVASACGLFTSVEIGACAIVGILAALIFSSLFKLQERKIIIHAFFTYLFGIMLVVLPYLLYLVVTRSFIPYVDSVYAVVKNMQVVINPHFVSEYPSNAIEALKAMVIPTSKNFRHMTPSYLYIILLFYLINRIKNKKVTKVDLSIVCIGIYGFIMYNAGFRGIWAAQFEMALQPEKILLFFIFEEIYSFLQQRKEWINSQVASFEETKKEEGAKRLKVWAINIILLGFFVFSLSYAVDRYNKRFFAFKYLRNVISGKDTAKIMPFSQDESRPLKIGRARGMVVPLRQAEELEAIVDFFSRNTRPDEVVFMYPELGTYSFLIDRPFLGRFPIATFSWFDDTWHKEFVSDLKRVRPRFVVVLKDFPPDWEKVYLAPKQNREKYREVMDIIESEYHLETTTPSSYIYKTKRRG